MKLHWHILRAHAGPFVFSLVTLMFIFLLQFIMKFIDQLVGKGLGGWVIGELIALNLAWMVVLAVPMSVLVSTLMAFGSLSGTNEVTAMKATGMSLYRMLFTVVIASVVLTWLLVLFNNRVLPEANHRAKTLITANAAGTGVGGARPTLSEDGSRLAFYSYAPDIVLGDTNGLWDIFVYYHASGVRTRVSLTSTGGERNQGTESASRVVAPALSGDGRYVAFATTASNMVPGDTNGAQDVFVVDTQTGAVTRASVTTSGAQGNADSPSGQGERLALSHDGTWVAFPTTASNLGGAGATNMLMHNRATGETRAVTSMTSGAVGAASMSRSGAYVVFGASNALDSRFSGTGLFSRFTGVGRSWWWID